MTSFAFRKSEFDLRDEVLSALSAPPMRHPSWQKPIVIEAVPCESRWRRTRMALAKKAVVVLVAVAVFGVTTLRPRPAQALDAWAWAGIGVAAYAAFVITMTVIVFGGKSAPLTAEDGTSPLEEKRDPGTIRFGSSCKSTDGNVPIACW
jgi:hypothetical protein